MLVHYQLPLCICTRGGVARALAITLFHYNLSTVLSVLVIGAQSGLSEEQTYQNNNLICQNASWLILISCDFQMQQWPSMHLSLATYVFLVGQSFIFLSLCQILSYITYFFHLTSLFLNISLCLPSSIKSCTTTKKKEPLRSQFRLQDKELYH